MDNLTLPGANELARRIRAYWAEKGKTVSTYVEVSRLHGGGGDQKGELFCVRSDMLGGLPQR